MVKLHKSDREKIIKKVLGIPLSEWRGYSSDGFIANISDKFRVHMSVIGAPDGIVFLRVVASPWNGIDIVFDLFELRELYNQINTKFQAEAGIEFKSCLNEFLESL